MTEDAEAITIATARGPVEGRLTAAHPTDPDAASAPEARAVILLGGADGGFDGPADALYPTLAQDFAARGVATLRVDFRLHRFPNDVAEGVHDLLAALAWVERRGATRVVLVGHSFGGAVAIEGALHSSIVAGVVTLATQGAGAQRVALLAPRPILLIHGRSDTRLPPAISERLYAQAGEPKELALIEGATHSLRQARERVRSRVREWACAVLDAAPGEVR